MLVAVFSQRTVLSVLASPSPMDSGIACMTNLRSPRCCLIPRTVKSLVPIVLVDGFRSLGADGVSTLR